MIRIRFCHYSRSKMQPDRNHAAEAQKLLFWFHAFSTIHPAFLPSIPQVETTSGDHGTRNLADGAKMSLRYRAGLLQTSQVASPQTLCHVSLSFRSPHSSKLQMPAFTSYNAKTSELHKTQNHITSSKPFPRLVA